MAELKSCWQTSKILLPFRTPGRTSTVTSTLTSRTGTTIRSAEAFSPNQLRLILSYSSHRKPKDHFSTTWVIHIDSRFVDKGWSKLSPPCCLWLQSWGSRRRNEGSEVWLWVGKRTGRKKWKSSFNKVGPFRILLGFYFHFLIQWYNAIDRFTMFISNVGRQERRKESMCFYKTGTLEIAWRSARIYW